MDEMYRQREQGDGGSLMREGDDDVDEGQDSENSEGDLEDDKTKQPIQAIFDFN